jgi:hypothetical protein
MRQAKRIEVIRRGDLAHVLVDGEELPAAIPRDTEVIVSVGVDKRPTVTLTLTADRVDVFDSLHYDEEETDR